MKEYLTYMDYEARLEYDPDDDSFFGIVTNIPDTIHFQGRSIDELREEFKNSVDVYLKHCEKIGKTPNKPYSGKFVLRVPPELHRKLAESARDSRLSLNALATRLLEASLAHDAPTRQR